MSSMLLLLIIWFVCSINVIQSTEHSIISLKIASDPFSTYALQDAAVSYKLVDSNVEITLTQGVSAPNIDMVLRGQIDAGITAVAIPQKIAESSPQLYSLPLLATALVPSYRIDSLGAATVSVTFTRSNLALIFMGEITNWADPRLADGNSAITLPNLPITMALEAVSGISTETIYNAFKKFHPNFSTVVPFTDGIAMWPVDKYYAYKYTTGMTSSGAAILGTDGSLGMLAHPVAQQLSVGIARMINRAGNVITPGPNSVTFAAVELGTTLSSTSTRIADLTDCSAASGWPIAAFSYLIVDTVNSRATCRAREALVQFILNFYQSKTVAALLTLRQIAPIPSIVMTQLDLIDTLGTSVTCRGASAVTLVKSNARVLGAPAELRFLASSLASVYEDPDSEATWTVDIDNDQVVSERLLNSEIDLALFNPVNVDDAVLDLVTKSGDYHVIPAFVFAWSMVYNPILNDTVDMGSNELILDLDTINLINTFCIQHWNDARIIALNPWLEPLIGVHMENNTSSSSPFMHTQSLIPCKSRSVTGFWPGNRFIENQRQLYIQANPNSESAKCVVPKELAAEIEACQNNPDYGTQFVNTETVAGSLVIGTQSAISYMMTTGEDIFSLPVLQSVTALGKVGWTKPEVMNMMACAADTFNPATLAFNLSASASTDCYPWTQQIVMAVRKQYTSAVTITDSRSCSNGLDALQFANWVSANDQIDALTNSVNIGRLSSATSGIQKAYLDALNSVLCDTETLMITLPIVWKLDEIVQSFGYAVAVIGLLYTCLLIGFTIRYHKHPTIRSASPLFILISLVGTLALFGSIIALVTPVGVVSCNSLSWLVNLGLMLTYVPIVAKTYRIYRIFGRRKLSVVKMSNHKLLWMVAAMLVVELMIMSAWQGISPLQPWVTSYVEGSPPRTHTYEQCATDGDGSTILGLVAAEKGALLLIGALMAFSTRKVSSQFNESSQIALSIYNVVFSIGIIVPIILVIEAKGDVLTGLLLFILTWASFFTASILVVPKALHILNPTGQEQNTSVAASSGNSSSGYSFLSLLALGTVNVANTYLASLRKHVLQVENHVAQLRTTMGLAAELGSNLSTHKSGAADAVNEKSINLSRTTPNTSKWTPGPAWNTLQNNHGSSLRLNNVSGVVTTSPNTPSTAPTSGRARQLSGTIALPSPATDESTTPIIDNASGLIRRSSRANTSSNSNEQ